MKEKRPLKPKFEAARDNRKEVPQPPKKQVPGSYKDLKAKVGPVFDQARDWAAEQRQKLTEEQRRRYDELRKERKKEEDKKRKAIAETQRRIKEEAEKRNRLEFELAPPSQARNSHLLRLGKRLERQRTELMQYQQEREAIETRFLKNPEQDKGSTKKPAIRRAKRKRSRDRGDEDRSR